MHSFKFWRTTFKVLVSFIASAEGNYLFASAIKVDDVVYRQRREDRTIFLFVLKVSYVMTFLS